MRLKLTSGIDTPFFGCFSVLLGMLGASFSVLFFSIAARALDVSAPLFGLAGALITFVAVTVVMLRRTVLAHVAVGADGVAVRGKFVPYGAILRVTTQQSPEGKLDLVLVKRDGSKVAARIDTLGSEQRQGLLERVHDEMKAYSAAGIDAAALEVLDRRERSVATWREELGKLLSKSAHYRDAPLSLADVEATLENVTIAPERRIGAAIALAAAGEPKAAQRIRVAAAECADTRLRVALESIAGGAPDEEALEEASRAEAAADRARGAVSSLRDDP